MPVYPNCIVQHAGLVLIESLDKLLAKDVSRQKITQEDADAAKGLITSSTKMDDLSQVDFVIEAVPVGC